MTRLTWIGRSFAFAAILFLLAPTMASALTPNGKLQIFHLDAKQGDAALIVTPLGQTVMIDDGTNLTSTGGASCAQVLTQLQALGVTHIDIHIASHYHADHIGCFTNLESNGITFSYGWDRNLPGYSSATYTNYVSALGSTRRTLTKGQIITLDSLSAHPVILKCVDLSGAGISLSGDAAENSRSVVMKLTYGEFDEELGGDLTGTANGSEKDIETTVAKEVGPCEVYKVHHHASAYCSFNTYLDSLRAKVGIISVGLNNGYGHPTSAALGRIHSRGIRTFWTSSGAGVAPDPTWDKVAGGMIVIQATWQGAAVDSIYFAPSPYTPAAYTFADTFTNSGVNNVDATPPVVTLSTPDGGETIACGSVKAITWNATDNVGVTTVDVHYSLNGGSTWTPLATGIANTGTYGWSVPNTPSATARVRVRARDLVGNLGSDSSAANFTIADQTAPALAVSAPGGGETWNTGSTHAIHWSASDNVSVTSVSLDFSADNGGSWSPIATGLANSGSYSWVVPNTPTSQGRVRGTAYDAAGNPGAGVSANAFGVADTIAPTAQLSTPTGGELLMGGDIQSITWSSSDNVAVDSVNVDYSLHGALGPWSPVAHGQAGSGTLGWTVPVVTTDSALVRVTAFDHALNQGFAVSDSFFHVSQQVVAVPPGGPAVLYLAHPAPNPSRGSVTLRFSLASQGTARLEVLDVSGRRVWVNESSRGTGPHSVEWNGRQADGAPAASGLYFVRLLTPTGTRTAKLIRF